MAFGGSSQMPAWGLAESAAEFFPEADGKDASCMLSEFLQPRSLEQSAEDGGHAQGDPR